IAMNPKRQSNQLLSLGLLFLLAAGGCDLLKSAGSKEAAQAHFEKVMEQWQSGETKAPTSALRFRLAKPISYEISSIVPAGANLFAVSSRTPDSADVRSFPAYQVNAIMVWVSEAGSPMETVEQ